MAEGHEGTAGAYSEAAQLPRGMPSALHVVGWQWVMQLGLVKHRLPGSNAGCTQDWVVLVSCPGGLLVPGAHFCSATATQHQHSAAAVVAAPGYQQLVAAVDCLQWPHESPDEVLAS